MRTFGTRKSEVTENYAMNSFTISIYDKMLTGRLHQEGSDRRDMKHARKGQRPNILVGILLGMRALKK
jgi:hypothetical protein